MRNAAVALSALLILSLARGEETDGEKKARKVRELVELNGFLDSVVGLEGNADREVARDRLLRIVVPACGQAFDDETLDAALAFFRSPAGRKYVVSEQRAATVARRRIAEAKCKEYYDVAMTWRMIRKRAPESLEQMEAPLRDGDTGKFVEVVADPWGRRYVLRAEERKLRVASFGPDGVEGTEDDVTYPER